MQDDLILRASTQGNQSSIRLSWNAPLPASHQSALNQCPACIKYTLVEQELPLHSESDTSIDVPRLPPEILIMIIERVDEKPDLANTCRVSKLFKVISEPLLYSRLYVINVAEGGTWRPKQQLKLLRTIRHTPRLSALITEFSHVIKSTSKCGVYTSVIVCTCDEHDRRLGKALPLLSALRGLHLLCHRHLADKKPHPYLLAPTRQRLQRFSLGCFCSRRPEEYAVALLSTPLVTSVTTLYLQLSPNDLIRCDLLHSALQQPTFLPNLRFLGFDGTWLSNSIISQRPIERIGLRKWVGTVESRVEAMSRTIAAAPGDTKAIFAVGFLQWLPIIGSNLKAFGNLTVIGTFSFPRNPVSLSTM